jgi:hypothetical protein
MIGALVIIGRPGVRDTREYVGRRFIPGRKALFIGKA